MAGSLFLRLNNSYSFSNFTNFCLPSNPRLLCWDTLDAPIPFKSLIKLRKSSYSTVIRSASSTGSLKPFDDKRFPTSCMSRKPLTCGVSEITAKDCRNSRKVSGPNVENKKSPPGFITRRISRKQRSGCIPHWRARLEKAKSKELSAMGKFSISPQIIRFF